MSIKRNVAANLLGKSWTALVNFVMTPVYIKLLGIESYGLIGFFSSLLALSLLLDLGLSTTINRELARLSTEQTGAVAARNLLRTFESIYWAAAIVIGLSITASSHHLAGSWLPGNSLGADRVACAIALMGAVIALRCAATLYSSGLMGLHKQVLANVVSAAAITWQAVSAVGAMLLFGRDIRVFFLAQALAACVQVFVLMMLLWRSMPPAAASPKFRLSCVRSSWHFAAGVAGMTILSMLLTQSDKILLSRHLSLENFGCYVLAGSLAAALNLPAMAMYAALFPMLAASMTRSTHWNLRGTYHASCQALAVLLVPAGCLISFFPRELLTLYLGDGRVVENTYPILRILALANTLLGLMVVPLALQLAAGWTLLSLYKNVVAVILYVPCIVASVRWFGAIGAACTWLMLVLGYVLFEIPFMHARLLISEQRRWYLFDTGVPFAICVVVMGSARLLLPNFAEARVGCAAMFASYGVSVLTTLRCFLRWGELKHKPSAALLAGSAS